MGKLGIVGGLGPQSTLDYYRLFVEGYRQRQAGQHPELVLYSASLSRLMALQEAGRKQELVEYLSAAVDALGRAGADLAIIASNTPHQYFEQISARAAIPLLSIVEATAARAVSLGLRRPGLLGTGFTMAADFYPRVLARSGLAVVVPSAEEQRYIHGKIFSELAEGSFVPETREAFLGVIGRLKEEEGIDGLILGCTELPLLFPGNELGLPFLNTTHIHVQAALEALLGRGGGGCG